MKILLSIIVISIFTIKTGLAQQALLIDTSMMKNTFALYKFPIKNNFIALSPLPSAKFLDQDIQLLHSNQITNVITLVQTKELESAYLNHFFNMLQQNGIRSHHFPIEDFNIPSHQQMDSIYRTLALMLENGENILIHCKGGLGRSGTVMAAFVKNYLQEVDPITYVREIRGKEAIENQQQQSFIGQYVYHHKD